jgi:hypothetical protein
LVRLWPITALARAQHRRDRACLQIDPANDVVLGVGEK